MTLLLFILILSILVLVHELGHFVAAKKAGIKVEEFAFGLPFTKPIFSTKKGETSYSIYPLIFGGFVKLYGEDGSTEVQSSPKEFLRNSTGQAPFKVKSYGNAYFEKSIPRRLSVLLAGVIMNLILGIVCFSILYFIWGIPVKTGKVIVENVAKDSPADLSGLKLKDQIISVNGNVLKDSSQLIDFSTVNAGQKIELEISRTENNPCVPQVESNDKVLGGMSSNEPQVRCKGENLLVYVLPRENPPEGEGPLGVVITDTEYKKYPFYLMPFLGVKQGFLESLGWGKMVLSSLGKMVFTLVTQGRVPKEVAGPVGIYQITGQAAKAGWLAVVQFMGILSVNLAIINILPIPAMDGGRLMFLGYEFIVRKKAPPKLEAMVNTVGMVILLGLMFLITINDVMRLVGR